MALSSPGCWTARNRVDSLVSKQGPVSSHSIGPVAKSSGSPPAAAVAGKIQQALLPNTSALPFTAARSVTIQTLPERSIARLSGLAKPMPPCQGVPPVAAMRQRNAPPGCSAPAVESSRRISQPKGQLLSPFGPRKMAGSACPSPSDPPAVKVISRSPVPGSSSVSSGLAVRVAPAALAARWASIRIAPSCSSPRPG